MKINTRFPVAVHIMTVAAFCKEKPATSCFTARSVNTNPVVIRRITAMLKSAGLVEVRPGVGGILLCRPPEDIHLLEIYNAVIGSEKEELFDLHQNLNRNCPVGANIHEALSVPLKYAQQQMEKALEQYTLHDIMGYIRSLSQEEPAY